MAPISFHICRYAFGSAGKTRSERLVDLVGLIVYTRNQSSDLSHVQVRDKYGAEIIIIGDDADGNLGISPLVYIILLMPSGMKAFPKASQLKADLSSCIFVANNWRGRA